MLTLQLFTKGKFKLESNKDSQLKEQCASLQPDFAENEYESSTVSLLNFCLSVCESCLPTFLFDLCESSKVGKCC